MTNDILWAESQVLGGMLLESSYIPKVYDILSADDFTIDAHRELYGMIVKCYADNGSFSANILPRSPERDKLMISCGENVLVLADTVAQAKVVKKFKNAYKAVEIMSSYTPESINPENVDGIVSEAMEQLSSLTPDNRKPKLARVNEEGMLARFYTGVFEQDKKKQKADTGYRKLDSILGGVWKSDLTIIAARPGVGKSAFAVNMILNLLKAGKNTALYSFEMSKNQVLERLAALMSNIPLGRLRQGDFDTPELINNLAMSVSVLSEMPLFVSDEATTIRDMKIECRIRGIDALIVDYLSLTPSETRHTNTYERVSELARGYKQLAQQLNIPVIVLAQLNRQTEGRASNKPTMADLRDSGEIEQAANQIIFLFEYENRLAANVAKNRQGETGTVIMDFIKPVMRIYETDFEFHDSQTKRKGGYSLDG